MSISQTRMKSHSWHRLIVPGERRYQKHSQIKKKYKTTTARRKKIRNSVAPCTKLSPDFPKNEISEVYSSCYPSLAKIRWEKFIHVGVKKHNESLALPSFFLKFCVSEGYQVHASGHIIMIKAFVSVWSRSFSRDI